ncbi:MATE family efflux transporter [Oceanicola sp. 22II-s10i]|uniref:MATE family efflux transporter n=1 Tax=Oceanicola sp. 22II-s10i TaxID=1317116 RepID=UPI000B520AAC|nr:MATE family efflux transporter [Oceanicola sp. 22II-s10i]
MSLRSDQDARTPPKARFLTGSTMRHVVVMSIAGSLGLSFLFLIDFLAMFWVSQYNNEVWVSAIGFAFAIQFFPASMNVGMMIATIAIYARALGAGEIDRARRIATVGILSGVGAQVAFSTLLWFTRYDLLAISGANGEARELAADFLSVSLFGMPLMVAGMTMSAVVRATGDAVRSTMVTGTAALVALVVDPFNILYLGLGVQGAAISVIITRGVMTVLGFYFLVIHHGMAARPRWEDFRLIFRLWVVIAIPAIFTQCSTPFGNWVLMRAMADFGDSATAALGVVLRLTVLVFGGIFALSGAIGGILGQNYGGGQLDRVAQAYKDALIYCIGYTLVAWIALASMSGPLARGFGLSPEGAEVMHFFTFYMAPALAFTGALYVANAAFNNLGRPISATIANWIRDGLLTWPLAFGLGAAYGANGVLMGQAGAAILAGTIGAWIGWRYVKGLRDRPKTGA